MSQPVKPLFVAFYLLGPDGEVNFDELRDLDMPQAGIVPAVGDYVYHNPDNRGPYAYQVKARHFDPQGERVAVRVEPFDNPENRPF